MTMNEETRALVEKVAGDAAERAATRAAEEAVQRVLTSLGVDHANPLETQRDMAALREWRAVITDDAFKEDLMHLRKWRVNVNAIQSKGMLAVVGVVVSGLCAAVWLGVQSYLGR